MTHPPKKLLDQLRDPVWLKDYAYSTENTHVGWVKLPFGLDLDNTPFYYEIYPRLSMCVPL